MNRLNIWEHPKTGEKRIYCNDGQFAKVWIEKCRPNVWGEDYEVKFRSNDLMDFNSTHREGCGTFTDIAINVFCYAVGATPSTPANQLPKSFNELIELAEDRS